MLCQSTFSCNASFNGSSIDTWTDGHAIIWYFSAGLPLNWQIGTGLALDWPIGTGLAPDWPIGTGLAQLKPIGGQSVASYVCNHRTSPLCGSLLVYSEDEFKAQMVSEWIIRPSFNSGQSMSIVANPMPIPCQSVHLI